MIRTINSWLNPLSGSFAPRMPPRIPSLDGLRAISILLVVIGHAIDGTLYPAAHSLFGHLGNYGVRIFFLISGFLITTLLLKEYDKTSTISLKNFYIRRSIRIFPAFYIYAAVIALLAYLGIVRLYEGDLLHAVTYTMNYHLKRAWYLNHIWSLSVEEQFYLLWPAVVLMLRPRKALLAAVGVIVFVPLIRALMWYGFDASLTAMTRHFQAVADALASGCLMAGVFNRLSEQRWHQRWVASMWSLPAGLLLMLLPALAYKLQHPVWFYLPGQTIVNFGGIILLDRVIRRPDDLIGRILNWQPVCLIGAWSYSIYLWQELFLDVDLKISFPLNLILTFGVSIVSYYLVEQQFLKLKERLTGPHPPRPV